MAVLLAVGVIGVIGIIALCICVLIAMTYRKNSKSRGKLICVTATFSFSRLFLTWLKKILFTQLAKLYKKLYIEKYCYSQFYLETLF